MLSLLESILRETTIELVNFSPDVQEEARSNLFCLSPNLYGNQIITAEELQNWLERVVIVKRGQIIQHSGNCSPMCFYCWVDEMAGQLRFSLVAASNADKLPFGCPLHFTDLSNIVQQYLALPHYELIPWEELGKDGIPAEPEVSSLAVWFTIIP